MSITPPVGCMCGCIVLPPCMGHTSLDCLLQAWTTQLWYAGGQIAGDKYTMQHSTADERTLAQAVRMLPFSWLRRLCTCSWRCGSSLGYTVEPCTASTGMRRVRQPARKVVICRSSCCAGVCALEHLEVCQSPLNAPGSCHGLDAVGRVEGPAVMQLVQVAPVRTCTYCRSASYHLHLAVIYMWRR